MLNDNLFVRNLNIIFMLKKLFLKIYFTIEKDNNINCSQEGIFVVKMSATHHV